MINIAICLSGEPRHWEIAAKSIKILTTSITEDVNIDVFFHMWKETTEREQKDINNPIVHPTNTELITKKLNPTNYIWDCKDELDSDIEKAWEYITSFDYKIPNYINTKEKLKNVTKYSNESPCMSQLISMCKVQNIRLKHEQENNIQYDVIIRTRADIELTTTKHKLLSLVQKEKLLRYVQFPKISLRQCETHYNEELTKTLFIPYLEFCFFVSSSFILNKNVFENYTERLIKRCFAPNHKKEKIAVYSSHCIVPAFLREKTKAHFGAPVENIKYKLFQFKK